MVSKINSTAIIVTWEKQSLVKLKGLADYIVQYKPIVMKTRKRQLDNTVSVPWTENHVVITNLISGAEYNVSVSVLTSAGISGIFKLIRNTGTAFLYIYNVSDPVLGDRVVSETPSSGDGVHYLGAIIGGVVLAVIIFVLLLTAAVIIIIMIAFMVNKHKAVY